MPTLHIEGLHCVKKRDPIGKDEIDIYVSVDGGPELFISGPHFLDKSNNDDFVNLHTDRNFTDEIKVRLKERDAGRGGNNDKDLGSKTYDKTELTSGNDTTFGFDGVSYVMDYRITA
jgi:hypothetical protein